jgi:hypothetical protein
VLIGGCHATVGVALRGCQFGERGLDGRIGILGILARVVLASLNPTGMHGCVGLLGKIAAIASRGCIRN